MDTQNTTLDLAVVRQQLTELAHAQVTLEQVEANLTPIYNAAIEAGDENTQALLTQAWNSAIEIANHANQAMALAEGVTSAAESLRQQRDHVAGEYDKLSHAVRHGDTNDPRVAVLAETIEEGVWEFVYEADQYRDGIHTETPGADVCENGHLGEGIDEDTVEQFLYIVMGYGNQVPNEMYAELATFITDFVTRSRAHWKTKYPMSFREVSHE